MSDVSLPPSSTDEGLGLPKVVRRLVADGPKHEVRCAVLKDGGTSPASDAMEQLKAGLFEDDTSRQLGDPWPDEKQPGDLVRLLADVQLLADEGLPVHQQSIQALENGIWELKVSTKRFTFFDTRGDGSFSPKARVRNREHSLYPNDEFWWFPDFDDYIRLGHVFPKIGAVAGQENIDRSQEVREEDLTHDV